VTRSRGGLAESVGLTVGLVNQAKCGFAFAPTLCYLVSHSPIRVLQRESNRVHTSPGSRPHTAPPEHVGTFSRVMETFIGYRP